MITIEIRGNCCRRIQEGALTHCFGWYELFICTFEFTKRKWNMRVAIAVHNQLFREVIKKLLEPI